MKATTLLKHQHNEVKDLFKRFEKASAKDKRKLFDEIAKNLVAHDGIERQIFYPACEVGLGMTDELTEALVEHGVVEFCLYRADQSRPGDEFDARVKVLKEVLEHHIDEEEDEFFPKVEKALDDARLESLAVEMTRAFEKAKAGNFRRPLHENLRQVLAGALKTKPAPKSQHKVAKKGTPKRRATAKRTLRKPTKRGAHRAFA